MPDPPDPDPSPVPPADAGNADAEADAEPPGPPAVRWLGRVDLRDEAGPRAALPGVRAVVRFSGTQLAATIAEDSLYTGPSRYDVIVDGEPRPAPFVPAEGTRDHTIVTGLASGVHVVELWRRTEAFVGVTQFRSFSFGEGGALLPPPIAARRRIEFLGDSSLNGYGVECVRDSDSFTGATQNERKAYPAAVARALAADYVNVSYSGKGVSRNNDTADTETFATIYGRTLPDDPTSTWDFARFTPDVVFIALGGNDFSNDTGTRPPPNLTTFKARYHELVALIRNRNPTAQILCTVAASLNDGYPTGYATYTNMTTILKAVVAERNAPPTADAKVHYYELPRADSSGASGLPDLSGCDGHSNATFHATIAADAVVKIKAVTGW